MVNGNDDGYVVTAPGGFSMTAWGLVTADVTGIARELLDDVEALARRLDGALAGTMGSVSWQHHRFAPSGLSLVGTSDSARVLLHTWPERDLLTVDLYAAARDVERTLDACVLALRGSDRE